MGRRSKFDPLDGHKVTAEEILNGHSPEELTALFQKYVQPNLEEIRSLTSFYTNDKQYVDEFFNFVLTQMYKYIYSYDPKKSLKTWIHIVTKRAVQHQNKELHAHHSHATGLSYDYDHENGDEEDDLLCGSVRWEAESLVDNLSDETLLALQRLPPNLLSVFLLFIQGHPYEEIVEIEAKRGYLDKDPEEAIKIVKNRIYLARRTLKAILKQHGITKTFSTD